MSCYCTRESVPVDPIEVSALPSDTRFLTVFGSRSYTRHVEPMDRVEEMVAAITDAGYEFDAILSGGADGADNVAELAGIELDVPVVVCAVGGPDSDRHPLRAEVSDAPFVVQTVSSYSGPDDDPKSGNGAYKYRNCVMAETAAASGGFGIGFWDGDSPGTQHMLDSCETHGVPVTVERFSP
jgi:hypothetical protein